MTVQTTSSRAGPFIGNGVTDQWSTNFLVDKADDLSVIYTDPSGVDSTLDQAQYSVVGFGDPAGVTVTYPLAGTPIGPNEKITLLREVDYDQQTSITNQGGFYPTVIEKALDRIVFQCQQLAEKLGRALLFPVSTRADFDAQLPQPQASTVLGFNALGSGFEIYPINAEIIDPSALPAFIGDSGEGGAKGVVPAPSSGDGAAKKYLAASGGWETLTGALGTAATRDVGTAANNVVVLDADAKLPAVDASRLLGLASGITGLLPTLISGTSTTASLTVSAGRAADGTYEALLKLGGGQAWSVANGNAINGYEGGTTLPNSSTIHFFICSGSSGTGTFASTSLTPTLPAGYASYYRRIFSLRTDGAGALLAGTAFETEGGGYRFYLSSVASDASTTIGSASRTFFTLSVPGGIRVKPLSRYGSAAAASFQFVITSPDETDIPTTTTNDWNANANYSHGPAQVDVTTDTQGRVCARASGNMSFSITTRGYDDFRRA